MRDAQPYQEVPSCWFYHAMIDCTARSISAHRTLTGLKKNYGDNIPAYYSPELYFGNMPHACTFSSIAWFCLSIDIFLLSNTKS